MGALDGRGRCREAAQYYYDLAHHDEAAVPEEMRRHVAGCAFCQGRMRHLGEALAGIDDGPGCPAGTQDRQTIDALGRHLDLMGRQITCGQVKPFLPHLVMPAPEMRIPTPVTVHVNHCPACAADLAALRGLALTVEQLMRLGWLYGVSADRGKKACRQCRSRMAALAAPALEDVPAEILDHVSTCASCRAEVYRQRGRLGTAQRQDAAGEEAAACPGLTPVELFDVVVPYRVAVPSGMAAAAAHVRTCPACREQVQALHRALYGIAERQDSGVATVYRIAGVAGRTQGEDVPTRCPVQVEILYREPAPTPAGGAVSGVSETTVRPTRARVGTRSLLKIGAAVVVIALAALQFVHEPTAVGLNPGDVLKTLEKAPNVHIISFMEGFAEPTDEVWIARRSNKLAKKTGDECILYDLGTSRQRIIYGDGQEETVRLTREERYLVGKSMVDRVGGLLECISQEMRRKEMTAVAGADAGPTDGFAVYELVDDRSAQEDWPVQHRWRVVIDSATGLPQRLEYFVREPGYDGWQLSNSKVFEYLTDDEMTGALAALFPPQ